MLNCKNGQDMMGTISLVSNSGLILKTIYFLGVGENSGVPTGPFLGEGLPGSKKHTKYEFLGKFAPKKGR